MRRWGIFLLLTDSWFRYDVAAPLSFDYEDDARRFAEKHFFAPENYRVMVMPND